MMVFLTCIVLAQIALVGGQILLKHGTNLMDRKPRPTRQVTAYIASGIGMLTLWFLLWVGLMQKWDLSYIYPFEGISPMLLVLAAWLILNEKMTWRSWVGVGLISVGVVIVGLS